VNEFIISSCGYRALSRVLAGFGIEAPVNQATFRTEFRAARVSVAGLQRAANAAGLDALPVRTNYPGLCVLPKPAIVHLRYGHFEIVQACDSTGVQLMGERWFRHRPRWLFDLEWSGIAVVFPGKQGESL
jgi:ABC-type bacteriocin/lantibiotic exporter with double-glycine peptidase domain